MMGLELQKFSAKYSIVQNAKVRTWSEEEAHMDADMYYFLEDRLRKPVVGFIGGVHYYFKPSTQVMAGECAIPDENGVSDPDGLLVLR